MPSSSEWTQPRTKGSYQCDICTEIASESDTFVDKETGLTLCRTCYNQSLNRYVPQQYRPGSNEDIQKNLLDQYYPGLDPSLFQHVRIYQEPSVIKALKELDKGEYK